MLPGDERGAESAHDAGDVGPDCLTIRNLFKAAQDGVVVESASLDYDIPAQL